MVRVCPERDGVCPAGMSCPYVKDRYSCRKGWSMAGQDDGPAIGKSKQRRVKPRNKKEGQD